MTIPAQELESFNIFLLDAFVDDDANDVFLSFYPPNNHFILILIVIPSFFF